MRPPSLAVGYAFLVPILAEAARSVGYALALHGTMARDLDVVAVPWTEDAADADTLVAAIEAACDGYRLAAVCGREEPQHKPHGRLAWVILLEGGCVIDLSVMPRGHGGRLVELPPPAWDA